MEGLYEKLVADFPQNAYSIDSSRGFSLVGIKGAFVVERLTEVFGLVGYGWRYAHSPFEIVDKEVLVEIVLQYRLPQEESGSPPYTWDATLKEFNPTHDAYVWSEPVFATGGNRIGKGGVPMADARKSAISSALSKAASRLGIGSKAYKGLLQLDGQTVTVKEDSAPTHDDTSVALNAALGLVLTLAPDQYAGLQKYHAVKLYHASLLANFSKKLAEAKLTDFIRDNLETLVGKKSLTDLAPRELLFLSGMTKSMTAEELDWEKALSLGKQWDGKLSWQEYFTPDTKDVDEDDG